MCQPPQRTHARCAWVAAASSDSAAAMHPLAPDHTPSWYSPSLQHPRTPPLAPSPHRCAVRAPVKCWQHRHHLTLQGAGGLLARRVQEAAGGRRSTGSSQHRVWYGGRLPGARGRRGRLQLRARTARSRRRRRCCCCSSRQRWQQQRWQCFRRAAHRVPPGCAAHERWADPWKARGVGGVPRRHTDGITSLAAAAAGGTRPGCAAGCSVPLQAAAHCRGQAAQGELLDSTGGSTASTSRHRRRPGTASSSSATCNRR